MLLEHHDYEFKLLELVPIEKVYGAINCVLREAPKLWQALWDIKPFLGTRSSETLPADGHQAQMLYGYLIELAEFVIQLDDIMVQRGCVQVLTLTSDGKLTA